VPESKPIPISNNTLPTEKTGKLPLSDAAKLLRGILASGAGAIFIASVYEYLSLAGVVDSMNAARTVLVFAGLVGFFGVLVSEIVWEKSHKRIVFTAVVTALVLSGGLWCLDSWTVRYREAHRIGDNKGLEMSNILSIFDKDPTKPKLPVAIQMGKGNELSSTTVLCGSIDAGDYNKMRQLYLDERCTPEAIEETYEKQLADRRSEIIGEYRKKGLKASEITIKLKEFDDLVNRMKEATDKELKFDLFVCARIGNCGPLNFYKSK
jgi:hypothetical protein